MVRVGTELMWTLGRLTLTSAANEDRIQLAFQSHLEVRRTLRCYCLIWISTVRQSGPISSGEETTSDLTVILEALSIQHWLFFLPSYDGDAAASALAVTMGTGAHCSRVVYGPFRGNLIPVKCGSQGVNHFKWHYLKLNHNWNIWHAVTLNLLFNTLFPVFVVTELEIVVFSP